MHRQSRELGNRQICGTRTWPCSLLHELGFSVDHLVKTGLIIKWFDGFLTHILFSVHASLPNIPDASRVFCHGYMLNSDSGIFKARMSQIAREFILIIYSTFTIFWQQSQYYLITCRSTEMNNDETIWCVRVSHPRIATYSSYVPS